MFRGKQEPEEHHTIKENKEIIRILSRSTATVYKEIFKEKLDEEF